MTKFHINDKGEPGKCSATKGHCPFGGADDHYEDEHDARLAYEVQMRTEKRIFEKIDKDNAEREHQALKDNLASQWEKEDNGDSGLPVYLSNFTSEEIDEMFAIVTAPVNKDPFSEARYSQIYAQEYLLERDDISGKVKDEIIKNLELINLLSVAQYIKSEDAIERIYDKHHQYPSLEKVLVKNSSTPEKITRQILDNDPSLIEEYEWANPGKNKELLKEYSTRFMKRYTEDPKSISPLVNMNTIRDIRRIAIHYSDKDFALDLVNKNTRDDRLWEYEDSTKLVVNENMTYSDLKENKERIQVYSKGVLYNKLKNDKEVPQKVKDILNPKIPTPYETEGLTEKEEREYNMLMNQRTPENPYDFNNRWSYLTGKKYSTKEMTESLENYNGDIGRNQISLVLDLSRKYRDSFLIQKALSI